METQPHILIIDDDVELSAMLKEFLEVEGFIVDSVNDGATGLEAATSAYSAIILDVMMPRMNGIEVLRRLRQFSSTPVLMLTAKGDQVDRVVGLELGADDYIAKPYYAREVVARLRAVLRRHQAIPGPQGPLRFGGLGLDIASHKVNYRDTEVDLTATEFSMLHLLVQNAEAVTSKSDLSLHALGRKREIYDRSVDVHISNLRQKLHRASREDLTIETIRGIGYRLHNAGRAAA